MDTTRINRHKFTNIAHSFALIGGMVGLLGLLGWLLGGLDGLIWTAVLSGAFFALAPRMSPAVLLKMYGARPIGQGSAPNLYAMLTELARRADLPTLPRLLYLPSRMMNAFTTGRREDSAIVLSDGLLRAMTPNELFGVMAHEISHVSNNDMWVMGLADMVSRVTSALSVAGQFILLISLPLVLFGTAPISLLGVGVLIVAPTVASLLQLALSRTREFDADLGAATLTGDPHGLASALRKLETHHGGRWERVLLPGRKLPEPSLLRTHPSTDERIQRLLSLDSNVPQMPGTPSAFERPPFPVELLTRDLSLPRWHLSGLWY